MELKCKASRVGRHRGRRRALAVWRQELAQGHVPMVRMCDWTARFMLLGNMVLVCMGFRKTCLCGLGYFSVTKHEQKRMTYCVYGSWTSSFA